MNFLPLDQFGLITPYDKAPDIVALRILDAGRLREGATTEVR